MTDGCRLLFQQSADPLFLDPDSHLDPALLDKRSLTILLFFIPISPHPKDPDLAPVNQYLHLPDGRVRDDIRMLTREIIYTAATRASRRLIVYGAATALQTALQRKIQGQSGMMIGRQPAPPAS